MNSTRKHNLHQASNKLLHALKVTGKRASLAGQKAKLGADVVLLNQKIKNRKHQFGVDLYDALEAIVDQDPMLLLGGTTTTTTTTTNGSAVAQGEAQEEAEEDVPVEPLEENEEEATFSGTSTARVSAAEKEDKKEEATGANENDPTNNSNSSSSSSSIDPHWPLQNIQGIFVAAYRNNKALAQKQHQEQMKLEEQAEKRRCVQSRHGGTLDYEVPADSVGERIMNAPKLARIRGEETRLKGNLASIHQQVLHTKYDFGRQCYHRLWKLEMNLASDNDDDNDNNDIDDPSNKQGSSSSLHVDTGNGWTPRHQDVRNHYMSARQDIDHYTMLKDEKAEDQDLLEEEKQNIS